ncbi:MAG: hypothetical protein IMZ46_13640 [Acidobacteria bacterium]|nr:hypothetical protein [Acidobacteriota bacterium]
MSAPQPGDGYGQYPQQPYESPAGTPPPGGAPEGEQKKKKRGYAAQAFDYGTGVNVAGVGQPPAPAAPAAAQYGIPQQPVAYGGYPQQDPQAAAAGYPAQPYGAPQPASAGGYQAANDYANAMYGAPGAAPGGVAGVTAGMGQMQVGPGQQPMGQAPQAVALNQLYPTDLLNQPFNVAELDYPPPPIILPPNVC